MKQVKLVVNLNLPNHLNTQDIILSIKSTINSFIYKKYKDEYGVNSIDILNNNTNINRFKIKMIDGLSIPISAFYSHKRKDFHPDIDIRNIDENFVKFKILESSIEGFIKDERLYVLNMNIVGLESGEFVNSVLNPALKLSSGSLIATCVTNTSVVKLSVEDGEVDWFEIEI